MLRTSRLIPFSHEASAVPGLWRGGSSGGFKAHHRRRQVLSQTVVKIAGQQPLLPLTGIPGSRREHGAVGWNRPSRFQRGWRGTAPAACPVRIGCVHRGASSPTRGRGMLCAKNLSSCRGSFAHVASSGKERRFSTALGRVPQDFSAEKIAAADLIPTSAGSPSTEFPCRMKAALRG